ncbi:hypothetical protein T459_21237 [Capsicum annuum]|uniref:Uncharacterized protein n=1 Tax=Capsicum annuum TaxID=4072 RepID=A0A2G2YW20_CAPAN|nr:putative zinc finger protein 3-like [Capsicum annuum]PHT73960.1 hypothetical protein T459_21237 [Capsicum annuum]
MASPELRQASAVANPTRLSWIGLRALVLVIGADGLGRNQCIHTGATGTGQYGILSKKFWSHSASSTALSNAINSDSIVEQAKQVCLDDFQETTPPPIVNTYPLVDFTSFDPGKLDESLVDSFNVPTYFPSPKDMIKAVEKNNYFSIERIELTYPKSKLVEKADAKTLMINLRAVLEVLFVNHFGSEIAEEAFTRTILKSDEISTWMKTNYQKACQLFVALKHK